MTARSSGDDWGVSRGTWNGVAEPDPDRGDIDGALVVRSCSSYRVAAPDDGDRIHQRDELRAVAMLTWVVSGATGRQRRPRPGGSWWSASYTGAHWSYDPPTKIHGTCP